MYQVGAAVGDKSGIQCTGVLVRTNFMYTCLCTLGPANSG